MYRINYFMFFIIVVFFSTSSILVGQDLEDGLMIGWASTDITPSEPVMIAGGSSARVFDEANDPVTSTVLVMESVQNGKTDDYVVMIAVDLVAASEYLKDQIMEKVQTKYPQLESSKFIMNASHTHAAPVSRVSEELQALMRKYGIDLPLEWASYGVNMEGYAMSPLQYIEFASDRISKAVISAWEERKPGGISYGVSHALVGQNRSTGYYDGHSQMYGNTDDFEFSHMEGYEDHSINLLYTWDKSSKLTGVMINVAVPAQAEYGPKISADYWHETRVELHKKLGDNLYIFPQIAAAGDISPRILIEAPSEKRMLELTGRTQRQQIGINIAHAVTTILPIMKEHIEWSPLFKHKVDNVELARRRITHDDIYEAKGTWHKPEIETIPESIDRLLAEYKVQDKKLKDNPELKKEENWFVPISGAYWRLSRSVGLLEKYELERTDPTITSEVHAVRIGDMVIITNPFELYVDFGMQMKARSKAIQTFVVQLAGEGTYVPTHRAVAGGTYGAIPQSNTIGPEGGRQLVNQSLALIETLWSEEGKEEQVVNK
jgi:hypothetical protein